MKPRRCLYCEKEFIPSIKGKKYCTPECRVQNHIKRQNAKRREGTVQRRKKREKKESDLARINAEARAMGMTYGQYEGWRWWKACHSQ